MIYSIYIMWQSLNRPTFFWNTVENYKAQVYRKDYESGGIYEGEDDPTKRDRDRDDDDDDQPTYQPDPEPQPQPDTEPEEEEEEEEEEPEIQYEEPEPDPEPEPEPEPDIQPEPEPEPEIQYEDEDEDDEPEITVIDKPDDSPADEGSQPQKKPQGEPAYATKPAKKAMKMITPDYGCQEKNLSYIIIQIILFGVWFFAIPVMALCCATFTSNVQVFAIQLIQLSYVLTSVLHCRVCS